MARLIEVTVSPQGETTLQTKDYAGAECRQASQFLEQALGVTVQDRNTSEFYTEAQAQQHAQQ